MIFINKEYKQIYLLQCLTLEDINKLTDLHMEIIQADVDNFQNICENSKIL